MTSPYNRASGLWADYFDAQANASDEVEDAEDAEEVEDDHRTELDKTIDKIGMGPYQWTLLSLCGFGWMADNCWIQAVAIVLPRVQQHYAVPDSYIGALSFSMFFGMMFGAVGWGTCSDLMGRSTAFNATLFFTAVFGVLAGFAPNFFWLCVALFFLGSAVGGSMPTDGTLLLEHMPNGKQYLLTALSVFFSLGAVLAAFVGITVIPRYSCPPATVLIPCAQKSNMGWRYMLIILGLMTLLMFVARVVFFRLHESPRYLVHAGRPHEAVVSLRKISEFNGDDLAIGLSNVEDRRGSILFTAGEPDIETIASRQHAHGHPPDETGATAHSGPVPNTHVNFQNLNYQSVETSSSPPVSAVRQAGSTSGSRIDDVAETETDPFFPAPESKTVDLSKPPTRPRSISSASQQSMIKWKFLLKLPSWARRPLNAWLGRLGMVLSKKWRTTTLLVWWIWFAVSLAYTMFNVYLPKLLETRSKTDTGPPKTLEETMWDIVIFTLGGCPGAILGAYLIQSPLGRRLSLSFSTLTTAAFCVLFVMVENRWAVRASTVGVSLSATTMWAVLYGMTPEIFATKVRGTACGTASALSRIGGMLAPLAGGALLVVNNSFPVYASIVIFAAGGLCVLPLRIPDIPRRAGGMLH
ncbi:MFS general substrate transporter [Ramaria rubella]|nr:MFS general substrate transporter [Ramaria rubella]